MSRDFPYGTYRIRVKDANGLHGQYLAALGPRFEPRTPPALGPQFEPRDATSTWVHVHPGTYYSCLWKIAPGSAEGLYKIYTLGNKVCQQRPRWGLTSMPWWGTGPGDDTTVPRDASHNPVTRNSAAHVHNWTLLQADKQYAQDWRIERFQDTDAFLIRTGGFQTGRSYEMQPDDWLLTALTDEGATRGTGTFENGARVVTSKTGATRWELLRVA